MDPDELAAKRAKRKKPGPRPHTKGNSPISAAALKVARKQREAVQLRIAGASLAMIAERVGYAHPSGAHQAITRALREMLPDETREDLRRLEIAKLDRLEMNAWPRALAGDEKAEATIIRAIGLRAKLLGLEAPAVLDVRVREGEMVRVEILDVLNDEFLEAIRPLQDAISAASEMRAGAIDVEAST